MHNKLLVGRRRVRRRRRPQPRPTSTSCAVAGRELHRLRRCSPPGRWWPTSRASTTRYWNSEHALPIGRVAAPSTLRGAAGAGTGALEAAAAGIEADARAEARLGIAEPARPSVLPGQSVLGTPPLGAELDAGLPHLQLGRGRRLRRSARQGRPPRPAVHERREHRRPSHGGAVARGARRGVPVHALPHPGARRAGAGARAARARRRRARGHQFAGRHRRAARRQRLPALAARPAAHGCRALRAELDRAQARRVAARAARRGARQAARQARLRRPAHGGDRLDELRPALAPYQHRAGGGRAQRGAGAGKSSVPTASTRSTVSTRSGSAPTARASNGCGSATAGPPRAAPTSPRSATRSGSS